ncbi:mRNA decay activator protein zfp36 [Datura stramonium]|uniref:mRNA decay activator protein zfp36 n=1 Tax=Datura stramonium TaxID=4076 RepID=A0ABS8UKU3_DATST|nr:mRNA decay activator protein zfp36 [Datura stramonium]
MPNLFEFENYVLKGFVFISGREGLPPYYMQLWIHCRFHHPSPNTVLPLDTAMVPVHRTSKKSLPTPPAFNMKDPVTKANIYSRPQPPCLVEEYPPDCSYFIKQEIPPFGNPATTDGLRIEMKWLSKTAVCLRNLCFPFHPEFGTEITWLANRLETLYSPFNVLCLSKAQANRILCTVECLYAIGGYMDDDAAGKREIYYDSFCFVNPALVSGLMVVLKQSTFMQRSSP